MIDRRDVLARVLAGVATSALGKNSEPKVFVQRLDRIVIVAGDLERLGRFYTALGFVVGDARSAPQHAALASARSATARTMHLGSQIIGAA